MTSAEAPSMGFEYTSHQTPESDLYPQLTSARYGEPSPVTQQHHRDYDRDDKEDDDDDDDDDDGGPSGDSIPLHPIPCLRDAFAESLFEVTGGLAVQRPKLRLLDGPARREALLAQEKDDAPFDASWRLRSGQTQHEIAKLISQISFGVHLLLDGKANSNVQVVDILQGHIDEVDEFLEVALEDLAQAEQDVTARIKDLTLPMADMTAFQHSLEDRKHRAEVLEGNQVVEHVIARTNVALRQWEDDVEAGLQVSAAFLEWLNGHRDGRWRTDQPGLSEIFDAMNGNAEGWLLAFERMSDSAQDMTSLVITLMNLTSDIEKKVSEASRRARASNAPYSPPSGPISRFNSRSSTPASSFRSPVRSMTRVSIGSGRSLTGARPPSSSMSDMSDETGTIDFPMPGHVSLMPPPLRVASTNLDVTKDDDGFRLSPATYSPLPKPSPSPTPRVHEDDDDDVVVEEEATPSPLYVLQPRTYTPQPPAPLPSPMVKEFPSRTTQSSVPSHAHSESKPSTQSHFSMGAQTWQPTDVVQKRISLRQRVSLKANPPRDIEIPPRSLKGMEMYAHSSANSTPRTTPSTYGSEEYHHHNNNQQQQRQQQPASGSQRNSPAMSAFHSAASSPHSSSPHSDARYYHPVVASPHSPLQQRPHTAVGHGPQAYPQQSMLVPPPLLRNRPSQVGGMSVASNRSTRSHESRASMPAGKNSKDDKLKKKKSAFGWLKKAFSMDEEERAAYEARKAMQHHDRYYDAGAPKFLDGRRVRR